MGLFKGLGKGLLGVVTKPVVGVVDFTAKTFQVGAVFIFDLTHNSFRELLLLAFFVACCCLWSRPNSRRVLLV